MGELDKNKLKDHLELASETVRKTLFSYIPAGPIFDSFWSYRSSLKQKRVLDFDASVKNALEEIGGEELHGANFETEDFVDLMELVYIKVMSTRSAYKLERFQNILVNEIVEPTKDPLMLKYVQLVDQLDDIQIVMLQNILPHENQRIQSFIVAFMGIDGVAKDDSFEVDRFKHQLGRIITKGELEFYGSELVSLGLVRATTSSRTTSRRSAIHNSIQISAFGKSFLRFIEIEGQS